MGVMDTKKFLEQNDLCEDPLFLMMVMQKFVGDLQGNEICNEITLDLRHFVMNKLENHVVILLPVMFSAGFINDIRDMFGTYEIFMHAARKCQHQIELEVPFVPVTVLAGKSRIKVKGQSLLKIKCTMIQR